MVGGILAVVRRRAAVTGAMRWQTTAALALLLAILGGFYYFYEVRWGPAREDAAARKGRVFGADTKDVTGVHLKRGTNPCACSAR